MSQTKTERIAKRQLGQFMTPFPLAAKLVQRLPLTSSTKVLEPSFGDGSFVIALIEEFLKLHDGDLETKLHTILNQNVFGIEIDENAYASTLANIRRRWGYLPETHNLVRDDFFRFQFYGSTASAKPQLSMFEAPIQFEGFDVIVGNPPFGGTIDISLQDDLDRRYGFRNGEKIKKETYSFFLVRSLDQLRKSGTLMFICSDTFLTIRTMRGLRRHLMNEAQVRVMPVDYFSDETSYPMVVLELTRTGKSDFATVNDRNVPRQSMDQTGNFSWSITEDLSKYFAGPKLGEFVICSSGMTIGKNELFVAEIINDHILQSYSYEFFDDPITLERERQRARLNQLSSLIEQRIMLRAERGETRRNVRVSKLKQPVAISLPDPNYLPYNKANSNIVYIRPTHMIYWKDDGDAVLTFKKNGNWYLHGVGGKPFFGREGLTWQLISSRLNVRYLPAGYILDSGAPCAFLREGVDHSELMFILGWTLTDLCTKLLKTVINHTKNIQSKDFERLPYPFWIGKEVKQQVIGIMTGLVQSAISGKRFDRNSPEILGLEEMFEFQNNSRVDVIRYLIDDDGTIRLVS